MLKIFRDSGKISINKKYSVYFKLWKVSNISKQSALLPTIKQVNNLYLEILNLKVIVTFSFIALIL